MKLIDVLEIPTIRRTKSSRSNNSKQPTSKHQQLARRLMKVVGCRTTVDCTSHEKGWARDIYLLCKVELGKDSNPERRVLRTLIFLEKLYLGKTSIPKMYHVVIESGSALRRKFIQIEEAMVREKQESQSRGWHGRTRSRREPIEEENRWFRYNKAGKPRGWINRQTGAITYQERMPT